MIVWGSGGDSLSLGTIDNRLCEVCEKKRPFNVILRYRYWGIYWIFNFVTERKYMLLCEVCQRGWELESSKAEDFLKSEPIPFMRRSGLLVLMAIVAGLVVLAMVEG